MSSHWTKSFVYVGTNLLRCHIWWYFGFLGSVIIVNICIFQWSGASSVPDILTSVRSAPTPTSDTSQWFSLYLNQRMDSNSCADGRSERWWNEVKENKMWVCIWKHKLVKKQKHFENRGSNRTVTHDGKPVGIQNLKTSACLNFKPFVTEQSCRFIWFKYRFTESCFFNHDVDS